MGRAKQAMMEAERRGWHDEDDRFVCAECIHEDFLSAMIAAASVNNRCDFCERSEEHPIAAPFRLLVSRVAETVMKRYGDVDAVGTPYADGQYLDQPMSTEEVLGEVGFDATPEVLGAVEESFVVVDWVEAPNGSWGSLPLNRELDGAWENFCFVVRHRTRFHFHQRSYDHPQDGIAPADMLVAIGSLIGRSGLVKVIAPGAEFYRGRTLRPGATWEPGAEALGAPPKDIATSGRMNPTGIPYLYLALDLNTMVAEMGALGQDEVIPAAVYQSVSPLRVVDFTQIPPVPSLFDSDRGHLYDELFFLRSFVWEISQPVERPRLPDIHYVPTQVMSEFLAQGFESSDGGPLDGVVYPSAANPGGRNIAIFPSRNIFAAPFGAVNVTRILTWTEVLSGVFEGVQGELDTTSTRA